MSKIHWNPTVSSRHEPPGQRFAKFAINLHHTNALPHGPKRGFHFASEGTPVAQWSRHCHARAQSTATHIHRIKNQTKTQAVHDQIGFVPHA